MLHQLKKKLADFEEFFQNGVTFFPCNHRQILTLRLKKVHFFLKSGTCYACATPPLGNSEGKKKQAKPFFPRGFPQGILRLGFFGSRKLGSQKALVIVRCRVLF